MIDRSFDSASYTGYSHALTFAVIDSAIAQFVVTPRATVASVAAADADRVFASSRDPFPVRFAAVADTFDAMTSRRTYRDPLSLDVVKAEFERCSGTQFDPEIAKVFLDILNNHYDEVNEIQEQFK